MVSCNSWNNNIIYMQLQIQFMIYLFFFLIATIYCHLNQIVKFYYYWIN